jgi:transposase-like protein
LYELQTTSRYRDPAEAARELEAVISTDGNAANGHPANEGAFPWGDADWFSELERTEDRCRAYLEALRWPDGVTCPRCESEDTARLESRKKFYCRSCRYHFSVTSGTLFHNSHLPTWKWFLTISLMIESEDGLPANQLVELLGVTYKTAWFAEHRVRAALQDGNGPVAVVPAQTSPNGTRARVFARPIVGRYHQLDLKYLPAYLAEIEWRSESRHNPNAFRDTVLRLLGGDPLAYSELVSGRSSASPRAAAAASAPGARKNAA